MTQQLHAITKASSWVMRWSHLIPQHGKVLDLACGHGRHMKWLSQQGFACLGIDRDEQALLSAQAFGEVMQADVENQAWPLENQTFQGVVVTNYLWRSRWLDLISTVAESGVLIYETFADGNATVGKPSNPDFLLKPGELLSLCKGLRVIAYEDGFAQGPERFIQRIVAVREPVVAHGFTRYWLND